MYFLLDSGKRAMTVGVKELTKCYSLTQEIFVEHLLHVKLN